MYTPGTSLILDRRRQRVLHQPGDSMRYAETKTDSASAVDVTDPLPGHYAPENMHRLAGTTGSRTGIMTKVTRCAIAALVGAVIILSWQIYSYRQIINPIQKAIDQQNILLDNTMQTHVPTDLSGAWPRSV